jgi:hypothetical protein
MKNVSSIVITREQLTQTLLDNLMSKIAGGSLILFDGATSTEDEYRALLQKMNQLKLLDISLRDSNNEIITDFSGTYEVSILLDEAARGYQEYLVVYETEDGIKVFKAYQTNNWLTFETPHFSKFYVLGLESETTTNTTTSNGILILILVIINLLLIILIIIIKSNEKKKIMRMNSTILLIKKKLLLLSKKK